jgi:LmbE family N-acetylglucosaminyl deacetylase
VPVEQTLTSGPVAVFVAHPDDETAGAGGILPSLRQPVIVHMTDGAPRDLAFARAAGYEDREEYARARRLELYNALELAGIRPEQTRSFDYFDQELSLHMVPAALRIAELLREFRPGWVLTQAYEGGHPDHDATAFVVHAACMLLPSPPRIYEFTSYHALKEGGTELGRFLPGEDAGETITLSSEARERKIRMLACFATQQDMLRQFPVDAERYRAAPVYDFTQAPHPGVLLYENFNWGMSGEWWRRLAATALAELGIPGRL